MRFKEFELTEDELLEIKMSPTNLARMARDIDARVGMEFELIVPNADADEQDEYESEPDYDADESFPTGRGWATHILAFFRHGSMSSPRALVQRAIDNLNEDFYAWVEEDQGDWINSNLGQARVREIAIDNVDRDDYESDEEYDLALEKYIEDNEDSIREQLIDEYNEDLDSKFEEWLDDNGISMLSDFANEYNLEWPYWTEPDSDYYVGGGGVSINDVANDFSNAIGRPVNASSSYHGATRQPGRYVVEPDSSLHGDEPGDGGLEFVSPPLTIAEMLEDIDRVAAWAERSGAYTNSSTGLHMNVSVPNQDKLDFVKLAMFLGDQYVLEKFGREGNDYCKSILKNIKTKAKGDPEAVKEMLRQFQNGLNDLASKLLHTGETGKYSSINNRGGWVEFRSPGGDWLGRDNLDDVKNTMLRAVVALDVATKPEAFKQEYYKKLYKTLSLGKDNDVIQYFAKYAAGELPQSALKAFVRQIQGQRGIDKLTKGAKDILLVWKVTGSASSPYQSQGTEVIAKNEIGAYLEAIKKWQLNIGSSSIDEWAREHSWRAKPVRAATTADMNELSDKFYRVSLQGSPDKSVYVKAMSMYQALTIATRRHSDIFANAASEDINVVLDPDYTGRETMPATYRARLGEPEPVWREPPGGEQSTDANYEIIARHSASATPYPVLRFIANTDEEAARKFSDWLASRGLPDDVADYSWRRIAGVRLPDPPETVDIGSVPSRDQEFTGVWEIVSRNTDEVVSIMSGLGNAVADAERHAANWARDTGFDDPIYVRPLMRARDNVPRQQGEVQARGTESLPPGNTRWLVLDQNDREVYSFVHRSNQGEANVAAANWLRREGLLGRGEFMVVPAR